MDYTSVPNFMEIRRGRDFFLLIWHGMTHNTNISWQAPGRKDGIIIREKTSEGKKIKRTEQVCYTLVSLKEAHNSFITTHADCKIGLSKFCEI